MSIRARVIIAVTFQQVDDAPDCLVPRRVQAGMKAGVFVLHIEILRRLLRILFLVKVDSLFFKDCMYVTF